LSVTQINVKVDIRSSRLWHNKECIDQRHYSEVRSVAVKSWRSKYAQLCQQQTAASRRQNQTHCGIYTTPVTFWLRT